MSSEVACSHRSQARAFPSSGMSHTAREQGFCFVSPTSFSELGGTFRPAQPLGRAQQGVLRSGSHRVQSPALCRSALLALQPLQPASLCAGSLQTQMHTEPKKKRLWGLRPTLKAQGPNAGLRAAGAGVLLPGGRGATSRAPAPAAAFDPAAAGA